MQGAPGLRCQAHVYIGNVAERREEAVESPVTSRHQDHCCIRRDTSVGEERHVTVAMEVLHSVRTSCRVRSCVK